MALTCPFLSRSGRKQLHDRLLVFTLGLHETAYGNKNFKMGNSQGLVFPGCDRAAISCRVLRWNARSRCPFWLTGEARAAVGLTGGTRVAYPEVRHPEEISWGQPSARKSGKWGSLFHGMGIYQRQYCSPIGHDRTGRRPALVVSIYLLKKHTGTCHCLSTHEYRREPFHVLLGGCAGYGFVMVEQVKSLDFRARKHVL
jgi:mRNA-degrading endonuclease toxin of MazEF toxin-antitoxin module